MSEWKEFFAEFGWGKQHIFPPIRVEQFATANHWENKAVMLAFRSGEMCSGLLIPASKIPSLVTMLQKSAARATEV